MRASFMDPCSRTAIAGLLLALAPLGLVAGPVAATCGAFVADGKALSLAGKMAASPAEALALAGKPGTVVGLSLDLFDSANAYSQVDEVLSTADASGSRVLISLVSAGAKGSVTAAVKALGGSGKGFYLVDGRLRQAYLARLQSALSHRSGGSGKKKAGQRPWASDPALLGFLLADGMDDLEDPSGQRAADWAAAAVAAIKPLAGGKLIGLGWQTGNSPAFLKLAGLDFVLAPSEVAPDLFDAGGKPVLALDAKGGFSALVPPAGPGIRNAQLRLSGEDSAELTFDCGEPCKGWADHGQAGLLKLSSEAHGGFASKARISFSDLKAGATLQVLPRAKGRNGRFSTGPLLSLSLPALVPKAARAQAFSGNIITARKGQFWDGARRFRFSGANNYYVRYEQDPAARAEILDQAKALGMRVLRLQANAERFEAGPIPADNPWFYLTAGGPKGFNEMAFAEFDRIMDECSKRGIRVIIYVCDNWEYMGGAKTWARWEGHEAKNDFFRDEKVQEDYRGLWQHWLTRRNTVNGRLYREDPTVFAWELMNEPRFEDDTTSKTLARWIDGTAAYIKSIDPKHMVSAGLEGFVAESGTHYSGADFTVCQKGPDVDFACYHLYPYSDYRRYSVDTVRKVVANYVKLAHEGLHKPVVMEEYAVNASYAKELDRLAYTRAMAESFFEAGGDGTLYWMLTHAAYGSGDGHEFSKAMPDWCNLFATLSDKVNP